MLDANFQSYSSTYIARAHPRGLWKTTRFWTAAAGIISAWQQHEVCRLVILDFQPFVLPITALTTVSKGVSPMVARMNAMVLRDVLWRSWNMYSCWRCRRWLQVRCSRFSRGPCSIFFLGSGVVNIAGLHFITCSSKYIRNKVGF